MNNNIIIHNCINNIMKEIIIDIIIDYSDNKHKSDEKYIYNEEYFLAYLYNKRLK